MSYECATCGTEYEALSEIDRCPACLGGSDVPPAPAPEVREWSISDTGVYDAIDGPFIGGEVRVVERAAYAELEAQLARITGQAEALLKRCETLDAHLGHARECMHAVTTYPWYELDLKECKPECHCPVCVCRHCLSVTSGGAR